MRNRIIAIAIAAVAMFAVAAPGVSQATAKVSIKGLAKAECREDKLTEPGEFEVLYGGTGNAAMSKCIRAQRREARADCVQDLREEPAEFTAEYGDSNGAAIKRCMRDELI